MTREVAEEKFREYQRLIWSIAKRVHTSYPLAELEDLFQAASIGAWRAMCNFQEEKGSLTTFLYTSAYREAEATARMLARDYGVAREVLIVSRRIDYFGLHQQPAEVIAEQLACPVNTAKYALQWLACRITSLDAPIGNPHEETEGTLRDVVCCESDFSSAEIQDFLDTLDKQERKWVRLSLQDKRQVDMAKHLRCSQVNIGRIAKRLQKKWNAFYGENMVY